MAKYRKSNVVVWSHCPPLSLSHSLSYIQTNTPTHIHPYTPAYMHPHTYTILHIHTLLHYYTYIHYYTCIHYSITHDTEVELLTTKACTVGKIRWAEKILFILGQAKHLFCDYFWKFKSVWHFSVMFSTNYFSIVLCWTLTSFGSKRKKLKE